MTQSMRSACGGVPDWALLKRGEAGALSEQSTTQALEWSQRPRTRGVNDRVTGVAWHNQPPPDVGRGLQSFGPPGLAVRAAAAPL